MRPIWFLILLMVVPVTSLFITFHHGGGSTNQVPRTAWYCSDDGHGQPRHLEQPGVGVHVCTTGELQDAGYWSGVL
jgi:hypothetical protein